jgi:hypothetical protein
MTRKGMCMRMCRVFQVSSGILHQTIRTRLRIARAFATTFNEEMTIMAVLQVASNVNFQVFLACSVH